MLPEGVGAKININSYELPQVFKVMQIISGLENKKMYNTYNMGIGMVLALSAEDAKKAVSLLPDAVVIGEVAEGDGVTL